MLNAYLSRARCTSRLRDTVYTFCASNYAMVYSEFLAYVDVVHNMVSHMRLYFLSFALNLLIAGFW